MRRLVLGRRRLAPPIMGSLTLRGHRDEPELVRGAIPRSSPRIRGITGVARGSFTVVVSQVHHAWSSAASSTVLPKLKEPLPGAPAVGCKLPEEPQSAGNQGRPPFRGSAWALWFRRSGYSYRGCVVRDHSHCRQVSLDRFGPPRRNILHPVWCVLLLPLF